MEKFFGTFFRICPKTGKIRGIKHVKGLLRFLFPLIGLIALVWILIRVIPKPSRLQYPCMKAATPIATSFLLYFAGLITAIFSFKKAGYFIKNSKYSIAAILFFIGITISSITVLRTDKNTYAITASDTVFVPTDLPNSPMGVARGIFPGRVVWIYDTAAATWDGLTGYWWDKKYTDQKIIDSMFSKALGRLTGKTTDTQAWETIFKYFNNNHGKGNKGYQPGEKIAIKINLNHISEYNFKYPGNASFTSPQVVLSMLRQLVYKAGVQDSDITFYDLIRLVPDPIYTLCKNEFPKVHFMGWAAREGREKYIRDTTQIHWSEELTLEKDNSVSSKGGNPVYLPTAITKATYLINLASFKAHRYAGVSFGAKNHFGTLSCDDDAGNPFVYSPHAAGVHSYMAVHDFIIDGSPEWSFYERPMGTYNTIVDLMGHRDIGEKTLLFMIDALYGVQSEQDAVSLNSKWLSAPFNNNWTSSLFMSLDDVALESVGLDFYRTEQSINPNFLYVYGSVDNYLHEASQADNPLSGTFYSPNGDGKRLPSLGVHEHWNNSIDKKYSRNLNSGNGIELISLQNAITSVNNIDIPSVFILTQNYPNPFNPATLITYSIPKQNHVVLKVYDIRGREVALLVNEEKKSGTYKVNFDGRNLSSGIYFYKIKAGEFSQAKKMLLLK